MELDMGCMLIFNLVDGLMKKLRMKYKIFLLKILNLISGSRDIKKIKIERNNYDMQ